MLETRQLKDNLVNQSFALRDLVQTKTKLTNELRVERELRERVLQFHTSAGPASVPGPVSLSSGSVDGIPGSAPAGAGAGAGAGAPPGSARKLSSASLSAAAALGMTVSPVLGRVVKRSEEVRGCRGRCRGACVIHYGPWGTGALFQP